MAEKTTALKKTTCASRMPFGIGHRVVSRKNFMAGIVVEVKEGDKVKVKQSDGKMLNFQRAENFMPYAEWTSMSSQRKHIGLKHGYSGISRPNQPRTETLTIGSSACDDFPPLVAENFSCRPLSIEYVPYSAPRISQTPAVDILQPVHRPVQQPVTQSAPITHAFMEEIAMPSSEPSAFLQSLRDMLPDDIPEIYLQNVSTSLRNIEPSWRKKWKQRREQRDLPCVRTKKIVVQKKIWGPNAERQLEDGEYEIDYVTKRVRY